MKKPIYFATDRAATTNYGMGETPEEAIRELQTELGWDQDPGDLTHIEVYEVKRAGTAKIVVEWE